MLQIGKTFTILYLFFTLFLSSQAIINLKTCNMTKDVDQ